jgi:hypothetical protein
MIQHDKTLSSNTPKIECFKSDHRATSIGSDAKAQRNLETDEANSLLGIYGKYATKRTKNQPSRMDLQKEARKAMQGVKHETKSGKLIDHPILMCGIVPTDKHGTLIEDHEGVIKASGVQTCKNLLCPSCAPSIAFRKAKECQETLNKANGLGFHAKMLTLTQFHSIDEPLKLVERRQAEAMQRFRRAINDKKIIQLEATRTSLGCDFKERTGWHVHSHVIVITQEEISPSQVALLEKAWAKSVAKAGGRSNDHGFMPSSCDKAAHYISNQILKSSSSILTKAITAKSPKQRAFYHAKYREMITSLHKPPIALLHTRNPLLRRAKPKPTKQLITSNQKRILTKIKKTKDPTKVAKLKAEYLKAGRNEKRTKVLARFTAQQLRLISNLGLMPQVLAIAYKTPLHKLQQTLNAYLKTKS